MENKIYLSVSCFLALYIALVSPSRQEFDFVIVGGGTAGCALASRLSENGVYNILLIHDGPLPTSELDIGESARARMFDSKHAKLYKSKALENRTLQYPVGRALGGGSGINGMVVNRGSPFDYDNWARMTRDSSWNYKNMLKYFKKWEDYQGDFPSDQHGYGGPITVSRPRYQFQLEEWLAAGIELGYPIADPNGPQKISFTPVEFSQKFGKRVSAYTGYIKPHLGTRPNLKIVLNAEAKRIIFQGKKAIGVIFSDKESSNTTFVTARKEIIVSGGAIGSPVLLMKSGIGPKSVLEAANVVPVAYLPVGRNLNDHLNIHVPIIINNKSMVFDAERDLTPDSWRIFNQFGDGPYTYIGGSESQAFVASTKAKLDGEGDWSDLNLGAGSNKLVNLNEFAGEIELADWEGITGFVVQLERTRSRGWIKLNRDVDAPPEIDLQYLANPLDMEIFIEGIKLGLKIYETPTYQKLGARYPPVPLKACQHVQFKSDAYWRCLILNTVGIGYHLSGTCRMGSGPGDRDAVVDSQLRVLGIEGLRVVDASIMPQVTNANTQAPVYAIAEKASEMILAEWKEVPKRLTGVRGRWKL